MDDTLRGIEWHPRPPNHPFIRIKRKLSHAFSMRKALAKDLRYIPSALIRARISGKTPYVLPFIDYLPNSAGRVACHRLIHELNMAGYDAFSLGAINPGWQEFTLTRFGYFLLRNFANPVVIYPEIISGNPLSAKKIVRWTLNFPGHLGGDDEFDARELVYTWSKEFFDTHRVLCWDIIDRQLFNSHDLPKKSGSCYYVGKGPIRGAERVALTDDMMEITRHWPAERSELARLLRESETFYTYDDLTLLSVEALECGCRVVLLPEYKDIDLSDSVWQFLRGDHAAQLERFIAETQSYWKQRP